MSVTADQVRRELSARLSFLDGQIQLDEPLEALKLDSLDLLELLMVIDELYHVRLAQEEVQQISTAGELADLVASRARESKA
jgi:acyl carrier protein